MGGGGGMQRMEIGEGSRAGGQTRAHRQAAMKEEEEETKEDRPIHRWVEERQEHPIAIGGGEDL